MTSTPLLAGGMEPVRPALVGWALVQGTIGIVALVLAAAFAPIGLAIALPLPTPDVPLRVFAGLGAWVVFGLIGGTRARPRPGGSVLTFSMPFVVAATALGGPLAGGVMGILSEWELRELRTTPWYGTFANHGVAAASAVAAGAIGVGIQPILSALLPGQEAVAFAITCAVIAFAATTLNVALVVPTLAIREGTGLLEASSSYDRTYRATSTAEAILAWLMAATYVAIGAWVPVVCVVLVLAVWRSVERLEQLIHDAMTGLLNEAGFAPLFAAAHRAAVSRVRPFALLVLDLDRFKDANDRYGMAVGDEVIRVVARRIHGVVRATDVVVRLHRAGDEFGVVLVGVGDRGSSVVLATRIQAAIRRPIRIREGGPVVEVDATIGIAIGELGTHMTAEAIMAAADLRMHRGKSLGPGTILVDDEPERGGSA